MVGLLNVDKPSGISSRRVVDIVARRARTKRVGHAGTLDPLASGVLVVCLGWATRLVPFVQQGRKRYRARFLLGLTSDTDDVTGTVTEVANAPRPTQSQVERTLQSFVGRIQQVPPQFSAVHIAGGRAHQLARRGESAPLGPRPVEIDNIRLIDFAFPELDVEIDCGSGTYVRSLARDLGTALRCGGVLSALVRERIGDFSRADAVSIEALESRHLPGLVLPPLTAVDGLPCHLCTAADRTQLLRGRPLLCPPEHLCLPGDLVALVDGDNQLLALAELDRSERLLRPRQVFLPGCSGKADAVH